MDKLIASLWGAIKSKTIWAAAAIAVLGVFAEPVKAWIEANPGTFSTLVGVLFTALRSATTESLAAKGNPPGQPTSP